MNKNIEIHHYTESGLSNIYVSGLYIADDDGESYVKIPALKILHALISRCLLAEQRALMGEEFYFLRAELGMTIETVAEKLAVASSILKNWQDTGKIQSTIDLQFRKLFLECCFESSSDADSQFWKADSIPDSYSKKVTAHSKISIKYDDADKQYHLVAA